MSQISIRIPNLEALKSAFRKAPETVSYHIRNMSEELAFFLEAESKDRAPFDTGTLKGRISTSLGFGPGGLGAVVSTGTNYSAAVHEGSKPHWAPRKALQDWADKRGIPVFIVQRAIAKRGTKAQPFMRDAVEENEDNIQRIAEANINAAVDAVARSTI